MFILFLQKLQNSLIQPVIDTYVAGIYQTTDSI
jgi:hypothetical protein